MDITPITHWDQPPENMGNAVLDLWRISLDTSGLDTAQALSNISSNELLKLESLHNASARSRYLITRDARRKILARYVGRPAATLEFERLPQGKPYLANNPEIHFNLSHTENMALLAVSNRYPLGVDVEGYKKIRNALKIAQRVFPVNLLDQLAAAPSEVFDKNFVELWTQMEAMQKTWGEGVFGRPADIENTSVISLQMESKYAVSLAAAYCSKLPMPRFFKYR